MFLMNFFYDKSKTILVFCWAHLVTGIWQTFKSQFHIFVGLCRQQKAEIISLILDLLIASCIVGRIKKVKKLISRDLILPSKLYCNLKMFLVRAQNKFYIEFKCRGACGKKCKSEFHVFGWFPGLQNLFFFLENLLWSKSWNHSSLLFLNFLIVFLIWSGRIDRVESLD